MKQKLQTVRIEDFNISELRKAAREGRLFIIPAQSQQSLRSTGINQILAYVSRIDECTSSDYRKHIHDIWESFLYNDVLGELFFFTRYSATRGLVNWYRVNVFICLLREKGIYQAKQYTGVDLHCKCERAKTRNAHYTCMNRYLLEHQHLVLVKQLLKNFG